MKWLVAVLFVLAPVAAHGYTIGEPVKRAGFEGARVKHFQFQGTEIPIRDDFFGGSNVLTGPVTSTAPGYTATSRVDTGAYDIGSSISNMNVLPSGRALASIRDAFFIDTPDGSNADLTFDLTPQVDQITAGAPGGGAISVYLWTYSASRHVGGR